MDNAELFRDILLVAIAVLVGGAVAHSLRLPTILGFFAAGLVISPNTPGVVGDLENIGQVADIGVILLMFAIGIQFSFRDLLSYRRLTLVGGGGMIVLTLVLGMLAGWALGLGTTESIVISFLAVTTSTVVALKLLEGRQQLKTVAGVTVINVCIAQEVSAVLMVLIVPSLGADSVPLFEVMFAIVKGIALLMVAYALSVWVLPVAWRNIAFARSRDLSLLAAVVLAIGLAAGSGLLGLSLAFGAFLAGLALSENDYGHVTLAEVIPLRDVFAAVFFLSLGMLIDPAVAWEAPETFFGTLALFIAGKALASMVALRFAGLTLGQAIVAALVLAQVGEFSFVIASTALENEVISSELGSAFLLAAGISILVSPALVRTGPGIVSVCRSMPGLSALMRNEVRVYNAPAVERLSRHVIVAGYGDSGRALVHGLRARDLPFVVIDNNPFIGQEVRDDEPDLPFVFGDATRPEVLRMARVQEARAVAVTFPSPSETLLTTNTARRANTSVDVVTRGTRTTFAILQGTGTSEVVDPEFEASLEFVRHVLHRYGIDSREITALQNRWRGEYYRAE